MGEVRQPLATDQRRTVRRHLSGLCVRIGTRGHAFGFARGVACPPAVAAAFWPGNRAIVQDLKVRGHADGGFQVDRV